MFECCTTYISLIDVFNFYRQIKIQDGVGTKL